VVVVMAAATYTRFYFVSWIGERVTADLRSAVFGHLLKLPPGFFEVTRTGDAISRLINDTAMLDTVIGSSASMAIRNLLLLIGGLVMLAVTSVKLTLLVLAGVPVVVVPIVLFGRRVRKLARATQDRIGDVGAYVDEALHEIRTVQAYVHEDIDRRDFGQRVEAAFDTAIDRVRQRATLVATVITLVFGAIGIILWIGGHDVVSGRLSPGRSRPSCSMRSSSRRPSARSAR
jgi:ATP-binding cassette subfamily B protein